MSKNGSKMLQAAATLPRRLRKALPESIGYRRMRTALDVRLISGPSHIHAGAEDVVAVCLVRDGEAHIESFLRHHLALGVKHIALLDNGSADGTVALARQFDNVTVLQSRLPFKLYKHTLRQYLRDRFGRNCWCLTVDIDERFDYPMSGQLSLGDFLSYLNRSNYSAVVGQMLDVFPPGPITDWPTQPAEIVRQSRWFDNSGLIRRTYRPARGSRISNEAIQVYAGGIRWSALGVKPWLTKHPLVFQRRGARPSRNLHGCQNAYVADVSCLLVHYKFDGAFVTRCKLAVERENYYKSSEEYKEYLHVLSQNPGLELRQDTAEEFVGVNQLVANGFLVVSEQYVQFVKERQEQSIPV